LPEDFIELAGYVEFRNKTLDIYPEHRKYNRRNSAGAYRTGTPQWYEIKGSNLYLYPAPTSVGILQFQYTATVNNIEDSATAYKKLNYKTLISGYWQVGKQIQGLSSGVTATIEEDINDNNTGTLVLSNIIYPNGVSTFANGESIAQIDEEQAMNLVVQGSWSDLITNWDELGLGARATVVGTEYAHQYAGDKPAILQAYHPFLIDYVKAMLFEDIGSYDVADRHMNRYYSNRQVILGQFKNRQRYGAEQVQDVL
jgi:hypothetical protein